MTMARPESDEKVTENLAENPAVMRDGRDATTTIISSLIVQETNLRALNELVKSAVAETAVVPHVAPEVHVENDIDDDKKFGIQIPLDFTPAGWKNPAGYGRVRVSADGILEIKMPGESKYVSSGILYADLCSPEYFAEKSAPSIDRLKSAFHEYCLTYSYLGRLYSEDIQKALKSIEPSDATDMVALKSLISEAVKQSVTKGRCCSWSATVGKFIIASALERVAALIFVYSLWLRRHGAACTCWVQLLVENIGISVGQVCIPKDRHNILQLAIVQSVISPTDYAKMKSQIRSAFDMKYPKSSTPSRKPKAGLPESLSSFSVSSTRMERLVALSIAIMGEDVPPEFITEAARAYNTGAADALINLREIVTRKRGGIKKA